MRIGFVLGAVYLATMALFCCVPRAGAQYRFSGTVLAKDSVPVANAIIQLRIEGVPTRNLSTRTDAEGRFLFDLTTDVETGGHTNSGFVLAQGFPNPFTDGTSLRIALQKPGPLRVVVYDLLGRTVRVLEDGFSAAGTHIVAWDGCNEANARVAPGLYFAVLQTMQRTDIVKLLHSHTTAIPALVQGDVPRHAAMSSPPGVDTLRVSLSVVDTVFATPRFYTMQHMLYALAGDSDVTIRVYERSAWRFLGLGGNNVRRLVLRDSILYACTANSGLAWMNVYSDTVSWRSSILPGPNGGDVHDVLVLSDSSHTFLAVTGEQETHLTPMYRSSSPDGPWLPADSGLSFNTSGKILKQGIYRLAAVGRKLIASGNVLAHASLPEIVWEPLKKNSVSGDWRICLEQSSRNAALLFWSGQLPSQTDRLAYSQDSGRTWTNLDYPNPPLHPDIAIKAIGMDPEHDGDILLATDQGMVKGVGFGTSWSDTVSIHHAKIYCFEFDDAGIRTVFAGGNKFLMSDSSGINWREMTVPGLNAVIVNHLLLDRKNRVLYLATSDGVSRMILGGR